MPAISLQFDEKAQGMPNELGAPIRADHSGNRMQDRSPPKDPFSQEMISV
jgi:hypothetical protein